MMYCLNGNYIAELTLSVNNRAFRYADGFFETIRLVNGEIPLWNWHLQRIQESGRQLLLSIPDPDLIRTNIIKLGELNATGTCGRVRITFFAGNGAMRKQAEKADYLIEVYPYSPEDGLPQLPVLGLWEKGYKAADRYSNIKGVNYGFAIQAGIDAARQGVADVCILNEYGRIAETTIANIFLIKDAVIYTPSLTEGPVAGVLRRYLLATIPQAFTVVECQMLVEDIAQADEIFLTNALRGIISVSKVGNKQYAKLITQQLFENYIKPVLQ